MWNFTVFFFTGYDMVEKMDVVIGLYTHELMIYSSHVLDYNKKV